MSNKYTVSTSCNGEHKDFNHLELSELESACLWLDERNNSACFLEYLNTINPEYMDEYYSFDSLYNRVLNALKRRVNYIVEPVSEFDDITEAKTKAIAKCNSDIRKMHGDYFCEDFLNLYLLCDHYGIKRPTKGSPDTDSMFMFIQLSIRLAEELEVPAFTEEKKKDQKQK